MIWALMKEPAPSHRRSEGEDRAPVDETRSTGSANGLADRRSQDDQSQAAEPPAWRVLLAYARPYRLTLIVGGLLSLATGVVVPRISRAASRTQESVGAMGTALERVLGAMRTVKASGAEQREAQRVDQAAAQVWQAGVRAAKWRRWPATPPGWPSRCRSSSCSARGAPGSPRARSTWAPSSPSCCTCTTCSRRCRGWSGRPASTRSARPRSPASAKPNSSRSNPPAPPPSRPGPAARPPRSPSSRCASATAPSCPRPTAASASLSHRVVVIDAGRVRAVGTHTELLSTDPLYAELAATQFLVAAD